MMKYVLLVLAICNVTCYSQNANPDLFQTWYLTYLLNNDLSEPLYVADIIPPITPTLTVLDNLYYDGQAACNGYSSNFTNITFDSLQTIQIIASALVCNDQVHNSFEDAYFEFLGSATFYQIASLGQGLSLTMYNPTFGAALFQNFSLNTTELELEKIIIYPNPSDSMIFSNFNKLMVSKIQIINSLGQNVKTIDSNFESINISDLSAGVYVLKINTEIGTVTKKIIKV